jgi:hypothetical protein
MLDTADAAFFRRRAMFLGTDEPAPNPHAVNLTDIEPTARVDANDPLEQAATSLVRSSIESQALAMQLPLAGADMDRMLSAAQHLMRGLPRHQLAALSPSSSIMQTLTAASFSIGMTADAQQRAMRLVHEQAALASQSAAIAEQARTGGQVSFGYQRPGSRSAEGSGNFSGSDGVSSARFAGLGGERVSVEVARQMQMASHEAVRSGIPWAVSKPDLLKLGPAAVKAVADVQIKEPTYQRLTTQAHFAAKDVVTLSTFAKAKGITDANPLAHATADVVETGASMPEQIKIKNAVTGYMAASTAAVAKPNDPAAQAQLETAGLQQRATLAPIAASSPENYRKVQSYEDKAKVDQRFRATAAAKELKADATDVQVMATGQQAAQQTTQLENKKVEVANAFGAIAAPSHGSSPAPTVPSPSGTKAAEASPPTKTAPLQVAEARQPAPEAQSPTAKPAETASRTPAVQAAEAKPAGSAPIPAQQPGSAATLQPVQQAEAKPAPAKAAPAAPKLA